MPYILKDCMTGAKITVIKNLNPKLSPYGGLIRAVCGCKKNPVRMNLRKKNPC